MLSPINNFNKSQANGKQKRKAKVKIFNHRFSRGSTENKAIKELQAKYNNFDVSSVKKFSDLPLSSKTEKGLKDNGYLKPTDIQRETILLALQGKDILGAAHTGSGKTLAFLIPLLEILYCKQWTNLDGVGALVITPTRELAYQIFECLRKVGKYHDFSAGLIIGGKDLKFEKKRMDQCNIVICTPGRLLQHMDENPLFDCINLLLLVLDEADRCLDMGFEKTMNAIISNLPQKRQTLLFSATQTKSVKDLARLSLKDPNYVSVHENFTYSTPSGLEQSYVVCELQDKISIIWSFIRNHMQKKCVIFFSSCKQVKYMFEMFCKLRPGTSVMALYGTLHQLRRMSIYEEFCQRSSAVLFATDLAARGLDFPKVHWVVQVDCPEDADTYIHRVGRTARYHNGGESLLLLLESEKAMVTKLEQHKIPIKRIEINPSKLQHPVRKMEAFLAKDPSLKESAQRAFVSYVKSVFLMKDKDVFNVQSLNIVSFANSLGLAVPPRIRFLQRLNAKKLDTSQKANKKYFNEEDNSKNVNLSVHQNLEKDKLNSITKNINQSLPTPFHTLDDSDTDDDILQIKRRDHDIELPSNEDQEELNIYKNNKRSTISKVGIAKKILRKNITPNTKIIFDEDGKSVKISNKDKKSELAIEYENECEAGIDINKAKLILKEEDKFDKELFKEKIKIKHKKQKLKMKQKTKFNDEDEISNTTSECNDPDLDWLPDPDKIYGKQEANDDKHYEYIKSLQRTDAFEGDYNQITPHSKFKRKQTKGDKIWTMSRNIKQRKIDTTNLSTNETEELAMILLKK